MATNQDGWMDRLCVDEHTEENKDSHQTKWLQPVKPEVNLLGTL